MNAAQITYLRVRAELTRAAAWNCHSPEARGVSHAEVEAKQRTLHKLRACVMRACNSFTGSDFPAAVSWWERNGVHSRAYAGSPIDFPTPEPE